MAGNAYVICVNDSVEAVVLEDEDRAKSEMERLASKHFERTQKAGGSYRDEKHYRDVYYWHLHPVDVL